MTIASQLHTEIQLINATLAAFAIDAGTRPGWTVVAGTSYIAYGLRTGRSQPIDAVERRLPELSERISAHRGRPTPSVCVAFPSPSKCPHPAPQLLDWRAATLRRSCYTMPAGRNYSAQPAADLLVRLDEQPHTLIAGTTGSGKSTLERMLLLSWPQHRPGRTFHRPRRHEKQRPGRPGRPAPRRPICRPRPRCRRRRAQCRGRTAPPHRAPDQQPQNSSSPSTNCASRPPARHRRPPLLHPLPRPLLGIHVIAATQHPKGRRHRQRRQGQLPAAPCRPGRRRPPGRSRRRPSRHRRRDGSRQRRLPRHQRPRHPAHSGILARRHRRRQPRAHHRRQMACTGAHRCTGHFPARTAAESRGRTGAHQCGRTGRIPPCRAANPRPRRPPPSANCAPRCHRSTPPSSPSTAANPATPTAGSPRPSPPRNPKPAPAKIIRIGAR